MRATRRKLKRFIGGLCVGTMALQFGGCNIDLGEITVASAATVNIRDVLIGLIRQAILTPIDVFITDGVNQTFDRIDGGNEG